MCFRPPQVGKPIRCPECGTMNPFNQKTCKRCKAELAGAVEMFKCPACGEENLPDTDACDGCGITRDEMIALFKAKGIDPFESMSVEVGAAFLDIAPTAPKADGAPGAPKAPAAPSAPKAPAAPSAPKPPASA